MVRALVVVALFAAPVGCGAEPEQAAAEQPGRYTRPDFAKLWQQMEKPPGDTARGEGNPVQQIAEIGEAEVYRALWKSVERAEKAGLFELYGMERIGTNEGGYEALFFVRTGSLDRTCFYANGDLHNERPDKTTIPARRAPASSFRLLQQWAAAHVPFAHPSSMTSQTEGGGWYLFHVYRDGKSHSALWYAPWEEPELTREGIVDFAKRRPVLALQDVLWAAAPPAMFPRESVEWDDALKVPKEKAWEFDELDVYGRAPGYAPRQSR